LRFYPPLRDEVPRFGYDAFQFSFEILLSTKTYGWSEKTFNSPLRFYGEGEGVFELGVKPSLSILL